MVQFGFLCIHLATQNIVINVVIGDVESSYNITSGYKNTWILSGHIFQLAHFY